MKIDVTVCADWAVKIQNTDGKAEPVILKVEPPAVTSVVDEKCGLLPLFDPAAGGWLKGYRLAGVVTQETTSMGMLIPESLRLRTTEPDAKELVRGKDYEADLAWGTVGRLKDGTLDDTKSVLASYRYSQSRLDSIVKLPDGRLVLKQGMPHVVVPLPPELAAGEERLVNLWIPGRLVKLTAENLYPITETAYPEEPRPTPPNAARLTPKAYVKLLEGKKLRILAWGDSVTDAGYLSNPATDRWQVQFVARLKERFPTAEIELLTEAWPGKNTSSYLEAPAGHPHNYQEKVLALKPDLIVSEFVNDGCYSQPQVDQIYARLDDNFKAIGAEWIILTPHYILPSWMSLNRQNNIDDDPRVYVKSIRAFAARKNIALADASKRWGRLWRQGLPYMTFLLNGINHPDPRGMRIFSDSLMELF